MKLVLVGGKSASKVEGVIKKNLDNVEVSIYPNLTAFVDTAAIRTMLVDRFIVLPDALEGVGDLDGVLHQFNDYICSNYPSSRFISLSKEESMVDKFSNIFLSTHMVHLHFTKVKASMLIDVASESTDVLRSKYGVVKSKTESRVETLSDVVDLNKQQAEESLVYGVEETPKPIESLNTPKKKKGGLFEKFKKKAPKKQPINKEEVSLTPIGQGVGNIVTENKEAEKEEQVTEGVDTSVDVDNSNTLKEVIGTIDVGVSDDDLKLDTDVVFLDSDNNMVSVSDVDVFSGTVVKEEDNEIDNSVEDSLGYDITPLDEEIDSNIDDINIDEPELDGFKEDTDSGYMDLDTSDIDGFKFEDEVFTDSDNSDLFSSDDCDVSVEVEDCEEEDITDSTDTFTSDNETILGVGDDFLQHKASVYIHSNSVEEENQSSDTDITYGLGLTDYVGTNIDLDIDVELDTYEVPVVEAKESVAIEPINVYKPEVHIKESSKPKESKEDLEVEIGVNTKHYEEIAKDIFKVDVDTNIEEIGAINTLNIDAEVSEAVEVEPIDYMGNIDALSDAYEDSLKKVVEVERVVEKVVPKVVEKIVEVEKVVEKVVEVEKEVEVEKVVEKIVKVGGNVTYRDNIRSIIVTGDRRSGVTRNALKLASYYAKNSKVLYVDFDIKRKGSISYIGIDNIIDEQEHVQHGIAFLTHQRMLPSLVYNYTKKGFDCLLSMYGVEVDEEKLSSVQEILSLQKVYSTVIIDCPIEYIGYMKDVLINSEVVYCIDSDYNSTLNTVFALSEFSDDSRIAPYLNRGRYLVNGNVGSSVSKYLDYIGSIFSLDEERYDWSSLKVVEGLSALVKDI